VLFFLIPDVRLFYSCGLLTDDTTALIFFDVMGVDRFVCQNLSPISYHSLCVVSLDAHSPDTHRSFNTDERLGEKARFFPLLLVQIEPCDDVPFFRPFVSPLLIARILRIAPRGIAVCISRNPFSQSVVIFFVPLLLCL